MQTACRSGERWVRLGIFQNLAAAQRKGFCWRT